MTLTMQTNLCASQSTVTKTPIQSVFKPKLFKIATITIKLEPGTALTPKLAKEDTTMILITLAEFKRTFSKFMMVIIEVPRKIADPSMLIVTPIESMRTDGNGINDSDFLIRIF